MREHYAVLVLAVRILALISPGWDSTSRSDGHPVQTVAPENEPGADLSAVVRSDQIRIVVVAADSSPIELASIIKDNTRRPRHSGWSEVHLHSYWKELNIEPGEFAVCSTDCEVQLTYAELDGKRGRELLLKLTRSASFCRYLVYRKTGKKWRFLGHIDHDFNRYEMARHRVLNFLGRPWLVIRGQEGSGSGFALYFDYWYQVTDSDMRTTVLSYPAKGNTYPWPTGLGRQFRASVVKASSTDKQLHISYEVKYTTLN